MFRRRHFLPIFLGLSGCGYVGEPLPPLLNMPQTIVDLVAVERGSKIIASFALPKLTTEGRVLRSTTLDWELRVGVPAPGEFKIEEWAARAQSLGKAPLGKGPLASGRVEYTFPAVPWIGKDVVIAARTRGPSGHYSTWSKPLVLTVTKAPQMPRDIQPTDVPEGVRLTWQGSGPAYRIFRKGPDETGFAMLGSTETPDFTDKQTEYGKTYRYIVEAVTKTGAGDVESDLPDEIAFTPKDIFPPAVPAGLTAVPTAGSVELTWDRNTESDLAGYRIYRAAPGTEFQKIGETTQGPSYSDRQVESGKQYRYAITSFDQSGNESKPSPATEVTAP